MTLRISKKQKKVGRGMSFFLRLNANDILCLQAMAKLNFKEEEVNDLLQLMVGILQLGNISVCSLSIEPKIR